MPKYEYQAIRLPLFIGELEEKLQKLAAEGFRLNMRIDDTLVFERPIPAVPTVYEYATTDGSPYPMSRASAEGWELIQIVPDGVEGTALAFWRRPVNPSNGGTDETA